MRAALQSLPSPAVSAVTVQGGTASAEEEGPPPSSTDLGSESRNSNPGFVPAAQAPACLQAVMPWPRRCLSPLQHETTFLRWLFPNPCPRPGHAMASRSLAWVSRAAPELLQEQSPDPTNALAAVPGHCSRCAPRRAYAVRPFSACPVTQEACGKARNKTVARKTSWQSRACLNH